MATVDKNEVKGTSERSPIQGRAVAMDLPDARAARVLAKLPPEIFPSGQVDAAFGKGEPGPVPLQIEIGRQIDRRDAAVRAGILGQQQGGVSVVSADFQYSRTGQTPGNRGEVAGFSNRNGDLKHTIEPARQPNLQPARRGKELEKRAPWEATVMPAKLAREDAVPGKMPLAHPFQTAARMAQEPAQGGRIPRKVPGIHGAMPDGSGGRAPAAIPLALLRERGAWIRRVASLERWTHGRSVTWQRAIVVVLDGVGIGEAPDAAAYGDVGSNSLVNTARAVGGLRVPHLADLGLGRITEIPGVLAVNPSSGSFGRLCPRSAGKDSITGHWELMGVHLARPFPTYPQGFPADLIQEFTRRAGRPVLGNMPASGTGIIERLGPEHLRTGALIVYTSADSVFQVAAHEEVVPPEELYRLCQIARDLLQGEHAVGRVIARPFTGKPGSFQRTPRRRDFPRLPPQATLLDRLRDAGRDVITVGKIDDMFGGRGITRTRHVATNRESSEAMLKLLTEDFAGLLFVNLIEFDMIHGHRNDPVGYARALSEFDACLPEMRRRMRPGDLAMIVADHGVDPTTPGTDHTREYAPLLVFGASREMGRDLGTRDTFSDVGATIAHMFRIRSGLAGHSFLDEVGLTPRDWKASERFV